MVLSLQIIAWSTVVLFILLTGSAVFMSQMTASYIEDGAVDMDLRLWLYASFGTVTRALYSMFECALTSKWTVYAERLLEDVSWALAFFWVPWAVVINFTVMKIVAAMF